MSKNNRKKNNSPQKIVKVNPNRRTLLKLAGGLGSLALLGGSGYAIKRLLSEDDQWGFLHDIDIREQIVPSSGEIPDILVPLGGKKQFDRDQPEVQETLRRVMSESESELVRRGWQDVKLDLEQRDYGCCEKEKYALQYQNYLEKAIDFLYQKLPQLRKINLDFSILRPGDDYSENDKGKAFIGLIWHSIQKVKLTNKLTGESIIKRRVSNYEGSYIGFEYNKKTNKSSGWVFFGTGKSALAAPFSEMLPLATLKEMDNHIKKSGLERALQGAETMSESLSYFLTKDMINLLNVPNGEHLHTMTLKKIISGKVNYGRYKYVSQAIDWLKKNSLQKGLDLYLENQEKFMETVTNSQ